MASSPAESLAMRPSASAELAQPLTRDQIYRGRRRKREQDLTESVDDLRHEVDALVHRRVLLLEQQARSVLGTNSALMRLVEAYCTRFRNGYEGSLVQWSPVQAAPVSQSSASRSEQETFLDHTLESNASFGRTYVVSGPDGFIDQWRRFTASFGRVRKEDHGAEISGPAHDPTVAVYSTIHGRITPRTFDFVFPFMIHAREPLMRKLIGCDVAFRTIERFRFSPDGRIRELCVEIDYVAGFMGAGASVLEVAELMRGSVLTVDSSFRVEEDIDAETLDVSSPTATLSPLSCLASPKIATKARSATRTAAAKAKRRTTGRRLAGNRARCQKYRSHQKSTQHELMQSVLALQDHVAILTRARDFVKLCGISAQHLSLEAPILQLVYQYLAMFQFGARAAAESNQSVGKKRPLATESMSSSELLRTSAFVKEVLGPSGLPDRLTSLPLILPSWEAYTAAFTSFQGEILGLDFCHSHEEPAVQLRAQFHVQVSRKTFSELSPSLKDSDPLIQRLEGARITFPLLVYAQFAPATNPGSEIMTLSHVTQEIGHIEGFMDAGVAVLDIVRLMQSMSIGTRCVQGT